MAEQSPELDIQLLIESRDFRLLKQKLTAMEIHDLGDLLAHLEEEPLAVCFRLLPLDMAADVFGDLPFEKQEELLSMLSSQKVATIVNDMPPDERTVLLEELPGQIAQRLLASLRGDELRVARSLLAYPEDSIGRLMTPEYVACRPHWTLEKTIEHIRKVAPEKETHNVVFVVDDSWKLLDEITLEKIILADPGICVSDLMDEQVTFLNAWDDRETAVDVFKKYDAVALPVVNSERVMVGIVTFDDVFDVAEEETTEDFQLMSGVVPLEYSYFSTGFVAMLAKRLPWLVMLLAAQMLTTLALTSFHSMVLFAVLVIFMPLINSPAGNAGAQTAGLMIRALAVQEVDVGDWHRVLRRELLRGVTMGVLLGAMGFVAVMAFSHLLPAMQRPVHVGFAVAVAMLAAVTFGNLIGSMLPFFFKGVGLDPAVTSGPFIASMMDVCGILIYFFIASGVLARST